MAPWVTKHTCGLRAPSRTGQSNTCIESIKEWVDPDSNQLVPRKFRAYLRAPEGTLETYSTAYGGAYLESSGGGGGPNVVLSPGGRYGGHHYIRRWTRRQGKEATVLHAEFYSSEEEEATELEGEISITLGKQTTLR